MRLTLRALAALTLLVAAFVAVDSVADAQQRRGMPSSYEEARAKYQEHLSRPSSYIRTRSAERMASFQRQEALDLLAQRYQRLPDGPSEVVRHTTASIAAAYYDDEEYLETWEDWLGRSSRTNDSWLWYHGQRIRARHGQLEDILRGFDRQRDAFLKAATIEAIAMTGRTDALELIPQALGERMRGNEVQRGVIIEACAAVLYTLRHELGSELYTEAATHVIRKLDDDRRVSDRTKLIIARYLKDIFNEPVAHDDADAWMRSLERGAGQGGDAEGPTRVQFMDIPAIGDRIAFIIDFSDSMMIPLTEGEKEELQGPTTGGGNEEGEDELPWDQINNRFELAREELKRTIRQLPEDVSFTVVVFGDEAEFLDSTPRLVSASSRVKRAVIAELDAYEPGPAVQGTGHRDREFGTLLGDTNMHGAFLLAYRVTGRTVLRQDEHVNEQGMSDGVDTIFLLSDGAPSCDDYMEVDQREPEDMAGDPEMGRLAADQDQTHLIYPGPYVRPLHELNHLLEDLRRMNLHRKAEIHTIGIGEFDPRLLEQIAEIGRGEFRSITGGPAQQDPRRRGR